jgi:hypothetical protein
MKKTFLLFSLILIISITCYSQTDTVVIIKTDTVFVPEKRDRLYKFFVENKEADIRHLWKVNLADIGLEMANITYEQRLPNLWSVEGYLSYGFIKHSTIEFEHHNVRDRNSALTAKGGSASGASLELEQLFKYYYNLNRRERHGKKTNGFSGNYFATSLLFNNIDNPSYLDKETDFAEYGRNFNIGIKYGIQRRIGNLGYYELYTGLYYRWESVKYDPANVDEDLWSVRDDYLLFTLGIKVGFAIDSFDNLREMIKNK